MAIRLAANVSWLFTELPLLDRIDAAAQAGFSAVEANFPYDVPASDFAERVRRAEIQAVLVNAPPGDLSAGDRGLACLAGREPEFQRSVDQAAEYATAIGASRVHIMAGIGDLGDATTRATYVANLRWACDRLGERDLGPTIEPINGRDVPGYALQRSTDAMMIIEEVDRPSLRLQFDLYHAQVMGGDLVMTLRELVGSIGHVQVAGVPERMEPDRGEINLGRVLGELDTLGYDGWVAAEYRPADSTLDGLAWAEPYL